MMLPDPLIEGHDARKRLDRLERLISEILPLLSRKDLSPEAQAMLEDIAPKSGE